MGWGSCSSSHYLARFRVAMALGCLVTIPWDGKAHFAPQIQFMAASFARGEWPWWTPNVFAGHPQIADPQSMIFSPPFLLLALLEPAPSLWAIDLVVFIVVYGAAAGHAWLTHDLGWHGRAPRCGNRFCFRCGNGLALQHFGQVLSLAYLPFALIFLRRAILYPSVSAGAMCWSFCRVHRAWSRSGRFVVDLSSRWLRR